MTDTKLFEKAKKLLSGTFFIQEHEYEEFSILKSVFKGEAYNFIVPKISSENFPFEKVESLIIDELINNYEFSYYIPEELMLGFKEKFAKYNYEFGWTDIYMFKKLESIFELQYLEYQEVKDSNYQQYLSLVQKCFPDYNNNEEYCNWCYKLPRDKNINLLTRKNEEFVCAGSALFSTDIDLGFFHNDCTSPDFRRQGLHSELIKKRCNMIFEKGITEVYANVEDQGASYFSYSKLGFTPELKMNLFTKTT